MESELSDEDFFGKAGESKSEEKSSRGDGKMDDKDIFELVERKVEPLQKQVNSLSQANDKLQQELKAEQGDKENLKKANEELKQELEELKNGSEVSGKLNELEEKVNVCEETIKTHEHNVNWNPQELAQAITGNEEALETLNQALEPEQKQEPENPESEEPEPQEGTSVEQPTTKPFLSMEELHELKAEQ